MKDPMNPDEFIEALICQFEQIFIYTVLYNLEISLISMKMCKSLVNLRFYVIYRVL